MFSRIKFFPAIICLGLLTGSMPVVARNTSLVISGIALATLASFAITLAGKTIYKVNREVAILNDFSTNLAKKNKQLGVKNVREFLLAEQDDSMNDAATRVAKIHGISRAGLDNLTLEDFSRITNKKIEHMCYDSRIKEVMWCAIFSSFVADGIRTAIKYA